MVISVESMKDEFKVIVSDKNYIDLKDCNYYSSPTTRSR